MSSQTSPPSDLSSNHELSLTPLTDDRWLEQVSIVMVNTTLPANIGSALRAMKTMGLHHLVLVAPKTFPHPDIDALAAGAADLIERITIVDDLAAALAECDLVFATSARSRSIPWPLMTVRQAAVTMYQHIKTRDDGSQSLLGSDRTMHRPLSVRPSVAIVFGREDRGLTNEELALANVHLTIPVNPAYGVLNVAQAIQVVCYELRMAAETVADLTAKSPEVNTDQANNRPRWDERWVNHGEMAQFYPHLEQMLQSLEFFDPAQPRLLPLRLRRLFGRIQLDEFEYHLLRGVFSRVIALTRGHWRPGISQKNLAKPVSQSLQSDTDESGPFSDD